MTMAELGFWIFLSVLWACETVMHLKGHDTFLFSHKTKHEKAFRDRQTGGS
jgi:hypothetical protein